MRRERERRPRPWIERLEMRLVNLDRFFRDAVAQTLEFTGSKDTKHARVAARDLSEQFENAAGMGVGGGGIIQMADHPRPTVDC